jgi:hypothetical protein
MIITGTNITSGFSLRGSLRVPDAPTIGTAFIVSNTSANVSFTAPTFKGDTPITGYTAIAYPGGIRQDIYSSGSGVITVNGLTDNTTYTFNVTANNTDGPSVNSSSSNSITTNSYPSAPTINYVELTSISTANIVYTAPVYNGNSTITSYTAVSNVGGTTATVNTANSGNITITGLSPNVSHSFSVYAINEYGRGISSNPSSDIFTYNVPGAPTVLYARSISARAADIVYTEPSYIGNSAIISYTARSIPGNITATVNSGNITVGGLGLNTNYSFVVTATNSAGEGNGSLSNSIKTLTVPNPPIMAAWSLTQNTANISYIAPSENGGEPILSYTLVSVPENRTVTVLTPASGSIIMPDLNYGTTYVFAVYATSLVGSSILSSFSNYLKPITFASAPGISYIEGTSNTSVTIVYTAPTFIGGSPVIRYTANANGIIYSAVTQPDSGNITITGLTANTDYAFTLVATNEAGNSLPSTQVYGAPWLDKDNYFQYVTLLLSGNGVNNANNNGFVDSSVNNFPIARTGNPSQGTYSPYGDNGNWCTYFDGSWPVGGEQDVLDIATSTALNFSGAYTVECWFLLQSNLVQNNLYLGKYWGRLISAVSGFSLTVESINSSTSVPTAIYGGGVGTAGLTIPINTWHHVAVVRDTSFRTSVFFNGSRIATAIETSTFPAGLAKVGGDGNWDTYSGDWPGYISQVRAVNNTAVYSPSATSITVPTTALTAISGTTLLACQSGRLADTSINAAAITVPFRCQVANLKFGPLSLPPSTRYPYSVSTIGGSAYFGGTSDYLPVPNNTALDVSSGDFTAECWFYPDNANSANRPILVRSNGNATDRNGLQYAIIYNAANSQGSEGWQGTLSIQPYQSTTVYDMQWSGVPLRAWHHCALVRSGNNFYAYLNGVRNATTRTISGNLNTGAWATYVGASNAERFMGHISDVRVVKGTALYTDATYTVPTAPVTAIANTSLLLKFANASIIDSAKMNNLRANGDVKISTANSKFGGSSIYFDGTGDYLSMPYNHGHALESVDFTIEAWVYRNVIGVQQDICTTRPTTGSTGWEVRITASNTLQFYYTGGGSVTSSGTIPATTWTHIAVSRSGTTVRLFINGNLSATGTGITAAGASTTGLRVGVTNGEASEFFNGYINDLRITKYISRYNAAFTPPTQAHPLL